MGALRSSESRFVSPASSTVASSDHSFVATSDGNHVAIARLYFKVWWKTESGPEIAMCVAPSSAPAYDATRPTRFAWLMTSSRSERTVATISTERESSVCTTARL